MAAPDVFGYISSSDSEDGEEDGVSASVVPADPRSGNSAAATAQQPKPVAVAVQSKWGAHLAPDVAFDIFRRLSPEDLASVTMACKLWAYYACSERLWSWLWRCTLHPLSATLGQRHGGSASGSDDGVGDHDAARDSYRKRGGAVLRRLLGRVRAMLILDVAEDIALVNEEGTALQLYYEKQHFNRHGKAEKASKELSSIVHRFDVLAGSQALHPATPQDEALKAYYLQPALHQALRGSTGAVVAVMDFHSVGRWAAQRGHRRGDWGGGHVGGAMQRWVEFVVRGLQAETTMVRAKVLVFPSSTGAAVEGPKYVAWRPTGDLHMAPTELKPVPYAKTTRKGKGNNRPLYSQIRYVHANDDVGVRIVVDMARHAADSRSPWVLCLEVEQAEDRQSGRCGQFFLVVYEAGTMALDADEKVFKAENKQAASIATTSTSTATATTSSSTRTLHSIVEKMPRNHLQFAWFNGVLMRAVRGESTLSLSGRVIKGGYTDELCFFLSLVLVPDTKLRIIAACSDADTLRNRNELKKWIFLYDRWNAARFVETVAGDPDAVVPPLPAHRFQHTPHGAVMTGLHLFDPSRK